MDESEILRWVFISFIGLLNFFAAKYVSNLASSVKGATDAGNRLAIVVAAMQRDVDFLMHRAPRRRESDFFQTGSMEL